MRMTRRHRGRGTRLVALATVLAGVVALIASTAASARSQDTTITVETLPIANALPLTLGVNKGFFAKYGITIKTQTLASGNDIALALSNHNGDIGYFGYVPMMIADITLAHFTLVAASEVEGASVDDNWQNIVVKGNSSIKTPADLAGKTISTNALKGLGEVVIRGSLQKPRRRPELGQDRRDSVPVRARRVEQRAGRCRPLAGAVPHAGAHHRRRPDPLRARPDARQVLAKRRLRRSEQLGQGQPDARQELPLGDEPVAAVLPDASGRDPGAPTRPGRRTCGSRSGRR